MSELTRRQALSGATGWLGGLALGGLLDRDAIERARSGPARARRVISLFMSGGPSHLDLFDEKPALRRHHGEPAPAELLRDQAFAMIQTAEPRLHGSSYAFRARGESGNVLSELLPELGKVADELCLVRALHTDTFNHDPGVQMMNTGTPRFGRPSMGAWLSYGLGSEAEDLPAYVVLISGVNRQPLLSSYWGAGFLPSRHQGVQLRAAGEPVLYVADPGGVSRGARRDQVDLIARMNARRRALVGDPEIDARTAQYELAFRMQASVPALTDLATESAQTLALYGATPGEASFSANCLLARRLVERGVRFVQLFHKGWDQHDHLERDLARQCAATDRGAAALLVDLRRRGLLDDTLVTWGGEFGRTPVAQGSGGGYGRDHHPEAFTAWMAGGGVRAGTTYGATDELGWHAVEGRVHVHDLHATQLHLLGLDHERLTFRHQGRDHRLTDVAGRVVPELVG